MQPKRKERDNNGQSGMIVVETLISFTMFVIVVCLIIYLINIFTIHNRIQFAINSAAQEISSYSYLYQVTGLRSAAQEVSSDGSSYVSSLDETAEQIVETLNKVQTLSSDFDGVSSSISELEVSSDSISNVQSALSTLVSDAQSTGSSISSSVSSLKTLLSNPSDLVVGLIYLGADGLSYTAGKLIGTVLAEALTEKYLENGDVSANVYLKSYGITDGYSGLDFSGSTVFCDDDNRMIDIVVEYDIDLSFAQLFIEDAKLHVVQRVTVPGWVDGDGGELPD